jgi:hypothetical protein
MGLRALTLAERIVAYDVQEVRGEGNRSEKANRKQEGM